MADIRTVWQKISAGQPLDEEEQNTARVLQRNFAPSSQEYKMLAGAIPNQNGPLGFGWPTLDFMNPVREFMDDQSGYSQGGSEGVFANDRRRGGELPPEPSPAAEADTQGAVTDTMANQMAKRYNWEAEGGPAMGGMMIDPFSPPEMNTLDGDYLVNTIPLGMREMVRNDPQLLMNMMGMGGMERGFMTPYMESALALSGMGMLGRGLPGEADLLSGPSSSTSTIANLEDFAALMAEPGTEFFDPDAMIEDAWSRANATDLQNTLDPRSGQPLGPEEQIDWTNRAVMAAAPFMTPETQALLSSRLEEARLQYLTMIASGDTSMTYPAYLDSIGIKNWLGQ